LLLNGAGEYQSGQELLFPNALGCQVYGLDAWVDAQGEASLLISGVNFCPATLPDVTSILWKANSQLGTEWIRSVGDETRGSSLMSVTVGSNGDLICGALTNDPQVSGVPNSFGSAVPSILWLDSEGDVPGGCTAR